MEGQNVVGTKLAQVFEQIPQDTRLKTPLPTSPINCDYAEFL